MFWFVPALICTIGLMLPALEYRSPRDANFIIFCAALSYIPYVNWALAIMIVVGWFKENI